MTASWRIWLGKTVQHGSIQKIISLYLHYENSPYGSVVSFDETCSDKTLPWWRPWPQIWLIQYVLIASFSSESYMVSLLYHLANFYAFVLLSPFNILLKSSLQLHITWVVLVWNLFDNRRHQRPLFLNVRIQRDVVVLSHTWDIGFRRD